MFKLATLSDTCSSYSHSHPLPLLSLLNLEVSQKGSRLFIETRALQGGLQPSEHQMAATVSGVG